MATVVAVRLHQKHLRQCRENKPALGFSFVGKKVGCLLIRHFP